MHEQPGYLRSGKMYKSGSADDVFEHFIVDREDRSIPHDPSTPQKNSGKPSSVAALEQSSSTSQSTSNINQGILQVALTATRTSAKQIQQVIQLLPPRRSMADDIRLPVFRGTGLEDPEQHWFVCEAVWNIKQVTDDAIKIAQLTTTFRDRALTWYMKYNQQVRNLGQIKTTLVKEFKKPKLESQCIIELKEIK